MSISGVLPDLRLASYPMRSGTWDLDRLSCKPLPSPGPISVQLPRTVSVANRSWLNAAYGPPLKTYVSHFDPVIGM